MLKLLLAALLRLSLLSAIFLGSCAGSVALYLESPHWDLDEVDLDRDRTFFGAYVGGDDGVTVVRYDFLPAPGETGRISYRLPREALSYAWDGGGNASITATDEADGSQLVRIHAIGDTPWVSVSEYRVVDNEIHPLRHGAANHFFLVGALLSPFVAWLSRYPVRRLAEKIFGKV